MKKNEICNLISPFSSRIAELNAIFVTVSEIFEVDLGVRGSYVRIDDNNPKHGFSHNFFEGVYAAPMIGWKKLKLVTIIGIGSTGDLTLYISPITIRYEISS